MFISIEGADGSGKTTQVTMLAEYFRQREWPVKIYRDPGDTPAGEAIRAIVKDKNINARPATLALLFTAARSELAATIRDDLLAGINVITDRWLPSTIAYQCDGQGFKEHLMKRLASDFYYRMSPRPIIVLDVPLEVSHERLHGRDATATATDRFESKGLEFAKKIRASYLRQAVNNRDMHIVGANNSPQVVHESVVEIVLHHIKQEREELCKLL